VNLAAGFTAGGLFYDWRSEVANELHADFCSPLEIASRCVSVAMGGFSFLF